MLSITRGTGFQLEFPNGYTVSVQFGPGNYCNRRDFSVQSQAPAERYSSADAEVAVIRPDGSFIQLDEYDTVLGWVQPAVVAQIISLASYNPEALDQSKETSDAD